MTEYVNGFHQDKDQAIKLAKQALGAGKSLKDLLKDAKFILFFINVGEELNINSNDELSQKFVQARSERYINALLTKTYF